MNIRELKKLPESLVLGELTERFATDNSRHKLALVFALAAYGRVETEYLVSRIDDIATADTANFIEALALDGERALVAIKTAADQCEPESLWRRKAKLAITALALGDTEIPADMCQNENRPDPGQRTIFINEFPRWEWHLPDRKFNLLQLAQLVAESNHSGLRSGLSLAVGSIPVEQLQELNQTALDSWNQLACRWFKEQRDTSTHNAASWLLRQWRLPLPEVPDQDRIRPDRDWFVNSAKMTMLRIQPPPSEPELEPEFKSLVSKIPGLRRAPDRDVVPESEYWISSCEVTRSQFESFMQDADYKFEKPTDWTSVETDVSPSGDHPGQMVSWYDAVMYCNWLSRREGKTAAYRQTGRKEKSDYDDNLYDQWELVDGATGYRLPLDVEWEYACRAGSQTEWSSGDDHQMLADYCQMYPSKLGAVVGHKLPNAWGLQGMHGNVWEWCSDLYSEGSGRVLRGGGWDDAAGTGRTTNLGVSSPEGRDPTLGFRVALSSPSGVSSPAEQGQGAEPAGGAADCRTIVLNCFGLVRWCCF